MTGSVVVSAGGPGLANVTIQGNSFQPSSVTVGVGGSVTWTNLDAALHTVTSN
jgi:plastocyanin